MFDYPAREIEKFLVMDRTLTRYMNKVDFRSSGAIEVTFSSFSDFLVCEYDDLSAAALDIHLRITTREAQS